MVSRINWREFLKFSLLSVCFLVYGCAKTPIMPKDTESKVIFFSTKDFRFYDTGFVKSYANRTSLEIFNAGVALLKMDCFTNKVCINAQCYAKESVVRKFFGNDAFRDIDFVALLNGLEIFNGENKVENADGFVQEISREGLYLTYKVSKEDISFNVQDHTKKRIFTLEILPL